MCVFSWNVCVGTHFATHLGGQGVKTLILFYDNVMKLFDVAI